VPTSIGHGLAAVSAGWGVAGCRTLVRALAVQAAIFTAVGASPDLDLLIHRHSMETHSLGAAAIVATIACVTRWPVAHGRRRIWLAIFCAYATHPILDMLAPDTVPPIGVMFLWPISHEYFHTGFNIFLAVSRHWDQPGIWFYTIRTVTREVLILGPVTIAVWLVRRPRPVRR
jgi:membrane-bound metal-dependent hydrolase YbcI (DUF457 family)